jgi:glycosyltransferase involved in cell wall biosynthesis
MADAASGARGRLRFTFVIGRYGEAILGGGEKHARDVAERLAARGHDVRVLTTCATSYQTWRNELRLGRSTLHGVEIVREPVLVGRLRPLDDVTKWIASRLTGVRALGRLWAVAQGPTAPSLVDRLEGEAASRDLLIFFSLLSGLTFDGLARVGARSVLVPLVHEEPPIYTRIARETLARPAALLVNTEEEWRRIARVTGGAAALGAVVAVGREEPDPPDPSFVPPTSRPYVLILGRAGKTRPMLAVWRALQRRAGLPPLELEGGRRVPWTEVELVTVGEPSPMYERLDRVTQLPFVDDRTRWQLVRGATALVNPSRYESLSLVLLEAWSCGRPVVVNRRCDVTVGQCRRSGGGIAIDFDDPGAGAVALAEGLASAERRAAMAAGGDAYTRARYGWDRVLDAYEAAARAVRDGAPMRDALAAWRPADAGG